MNRSWDQSRGSHTRQQSSEQVLHLIRGRLRLGDRCHLYLLYDLVRVTSHIGWKNRFRTRLTDPPNLWVCVTLPDSASVHNISYRSFRYTVQIPMQLTTTKSSYKAIADQPQSCRLSHIPKSFDGQCFQGYGKYGGVFPCRPSRFFKLPSIVRQSARRTIMCRQCVHHERRGRHKERRGRHNEKLHMRRDRETRCLVRRQKSRRLYSGTPSRPMDHPSPVPRSPLGSPNGSTYLQYEDVLDMVQKLHKELGLIILDYDKIGTVCSQLLKDNQARDRAIGDLTGLVQRSLDHPATQCHRPETTPPHPIIQPDLIDNEGNLRAEDIRITWEGSDTFLHGVRVVASDAASSTASVYFDSVSAGPRTCGM